MPGREGGKRYYSPKTLKVLFAFSGNLCAVPGCSNPIVAQATADPDAAVVGQICHIYAAKDRGPRGNPNLSEKERNAPENLILMCGAHHPLVDQQHETYPADLLLEWKRTHEAKHRPGSPETTSGLGLMRSAAFVSKACDDEIERGVIRLRQGRLYANFPAQEAALSLADRIGDGDLSAGTAQVRGKGLAWCARVLSLVLPQQARKLLEDAKVLTTDETTRIAEAALIASEDRAAALGILSRLTSSAARTAALRIVKNQSGAEALLRWVRQTELSFNAIDAEGKFVLIVAELETDQWHSAREHAQQVADADYIECPALYSAAGMALLLIAVPEDLRRQVRSGIPFNVRTLPLAADEALDVRREAARLFAKSSEAVQAFDAAGPGNVDADYALWLRLNDPSETAEALEDLRDSMRDPRLALRRIHFAFQFGIELDTARIEAEIDRHAALAGGPTADEASARFSLAIASHDAHVIVTATDKYRRLFAAHLHGGAIAAAEIEALIQAGLLDRARQRLHEADQAGVLVHGRMRVDGRLAEAEGADPITLRRRQFEATSDLIDLASLIDLYESRELWTELRPLAEQLFERTRSLPDGLRVARAYDQLGDARALVDHLEANRFLIEQSGALKTPFAWSLYRLGHLADAESVLQTIEPAQRNANDRGLAINIAVASGRWAEIAALTTAEWNCRADRSARELLLAGKLARAVGAPHSQELIVAATERAPDDPHILSAAYMQAVSSGWEGEESAAWLSRAAALSGENGPMKAVSLQELAAMKPEWDQTEETIGRQLCEATTPQFGAARGLNRSLLELALTPAFANVHEPDVRRQGVIFSYSGAHGRPAVTSLAKIALDVTAILCLGRLGILGQVVAAFETIVIAHGTLAWLFEEQGNATFQQTSRMHEARAIRELMAAGKIQVLEQPPPRNHKLADEVGYELADLFAAANARSHLSSAYVVTTGPIYRVGSLMAEAADLGPLSELVCDCGSVVSKLRTQGVLSAGDERQAIDFLSMREPAPGQKKTVSDQAELYIDGLSVSRLHKAGVLGLLTAAGLKVFVSGSVRNQVNALFNFDSLSRNICKTIENVRAVFAEGIRQGRVQLSLSDENDTQPSMRHPTYDLLKKGHMVDAIVIDDRFLNRHSLMNINGIQTPIFTTQDLLADLADRGVMSADQYHEHRTLLRRSGYQLIELSCEELQWFLRQATVDGVFFETAELKAIRFSLLKARMARVLNLPYEAPWLHRSLSTIIRTIKKIWLEECSFTLSDVKSRSGWLIGLVTDVKGWACCAPAESAIAFSFVAQAAQFLELVSAPGGIPSERGDAYHAWIDDNLLEILELESPEIFAWLIARIREILISFVDSGDGPSDEKGALSLSPRMKALAGIRLYPSRIRNAVLADAEVRERLHLNRDATFKFGASGPSFQRSQLLSAIRTLKDASSFASVAALDGSTWKVQGAEKEPGLIAFSKERAVFRSGQFGVLVKSRTRRKVALQAEVRRVGMPPEPAEA